MKSWAPFPHAGRFGFSVARLRREWDQLHAGDREPWPDSSELVRAWSLFHGGEFEAAWHESQRLGLVGTVLACKSACMYATHLEPHEEKRLALYSEVADCAQRLARAEPECAAAWYWQAYALGRYSQGISVAKALAQGLGTRVRSALEKTIALEPQHADAHLALGAFHAEVIDKVGALIGSMTYGAKKEVGLRHYETALEIHPASPMAMVEYANALVMIEGEKAMTQALDWHTRATTCVPLDATQWLEVQLAHQERKALQQVMNLPP